MGWLALNAAAFLWLLWNSSRNKLSGSVHAGGGTQAAEQKVERWDAAELHVVELLHASNDLSRAREIFAAEKKRRPRGRYTLRQNIRVLERWPPN
jgi:hypothetical protein